MVGARQLERRRDFDDFDDGRRQRAARHRTAHIHTRTHVMMGGGVRGERGR